MDNVELSVGWPGLDFMSNRLHVIRGSRKDLGPCQVKVNGTDHYEEPPIRADEDSFALPGDVVDTLHDIPVVSNGPINPSPDDSGVSVERLASNLPSRAMSEGNPVLVRPKVVDKDYLRAIATPTRPRIIATARRPRLSAHEQSRDAVVASSAATSATPSIGGKFFNCFP